MKTYRIPQTDLEVSRLAYGTWHIGGTWDSQPLTQELYDRADRLLHAAVEQGITMIDFANIYTRGKSDTVIGEALHKSPGLRDKLVLQQKCGIVLSTEDTIAHFDFSYKNIVESLEGSLQRMQTDHVEILLLHRPDPLVEPEEVARAFDMLQSSGKVRYFGVSNHTPMQIELLKKFVRQPLVINQVELNLLHHYMISDGIVADMVSSNHQNPYAGIGGTLDYCRLNDIMIQAWSPVAMGKLFNPPADAPSNIQNTAREIVRLAQKYQTTPEAIALAWLLRHPAKIQPIIGTLNVERIGDSCKADNVELTHVEWYELLAAARGVGIP